MADFPTEPNALRQNLLARFGAIRDVIASGAAENERLRTLEPATVEALAQSGLWRFKSPREVGGAEADPLVQMDLIEAVTAVDPAVGWCLFIGASVVGSACSRLPEEGLAELLAGEEAPRMSGSLRPGGVATPVEGGYRITGRWGWSSGIGHATWVNALCLSDGATPGLPVVAAVLPRSDVEVHDNWFTAGMRGSGSSDYSAVDVFVPHRRILGPNQRGGALFRLGMPAFVLNEHASFALGIARRCLDAIVELAASKKRGYIVQRSLADRETFQRMVGHSEVRWQAARSAIRMSYAAIWADVEGGKTLTSTQLAQLRAMATFVNDEALDIVAQAYRAGAGTAVFSDNVLQQGLGDLQVASAHLMVSDSAYELYGADRLGNNPDSSIAGIT